MQSIIKFLKEKKEKLIKIKLFFKMLKERNLSIH